MILEALSWDLHLKQHPSVFCFSRKLLQTDSTSFSTLQVVKIQLCLHSAGSSWTGSATNYIPSRLYNWAHMTPSALGCFPGWNCLASPESSLRRCPSQPQVLSTESAAASSFHQFACLLYQTLGLRDWDDPLETSPPNWPLPSVSVCLGSLQRLYSLLRWSGWGFVLPGFILISNQLSQNLLKDHVPTYHAFQKKFFCTQIFFLFLRSFYFWWMPEGSFFANSAGPRYRSLWKWFARLIMAPRFYIFQNKQTWILPFIFNSNGIEGYSKYYLSKT